jgi:hypothetical protein
MTAPGVEAKRILVSGSRGKSSVVRLLHAGLNATGIPTWSRITGTDPRQLEPDGERSIERAAGAHVEEMRWWLGQVPAAAGALVMENSAVTPELQPLAAAWLRPDVTVLTNVLPDHQEAWGVDERDAVLALVPGLPRGGTVVIPDSLQEHPLLAPMLADRRCRVLVAKSWRNVDTSHRAANLGLARTVLEYFGQASEASMKAMRELKADRYDFQLRQVAGAEVALAFSANDIQSTRALFDSLGWSADRTRLLYNHRADRPGRLESFRAWIEEGPWRETLVTGARPLRRLKGARYVKLDERKKLAALLREGDRLFGCGNIAGLPPEWYREG